MVVWSDETMINPIWFMPLTLRLKLKQQHEQTPFLHKFKEQICLRTLWSVFFHFLEAFLDQRSDNLDMFVSFRVLLCASPIDPSFFFKFLDIIKTARHWSYVSPDAFKPMMVGVSSQEHFGRLKRLGRLGRVQEQICSLCSAALEAFGTVWTVSGQIQLAKSESISGRRIGHHWILWLVVC